MKNIAIVIIITMLSLSVIPANASVYGSGVRPQTLYDQNGNAFQYDPNSDQYYHNGATAPVGHPLYDTPGQQGHAYYPNMGNPSPSSSYAPSVSPGTAVGVLLGAILINAIVRGSSAKAHEAPRHQQTAQIHEEPLYYNEPEASYGEQREITSQERTHYSKIWSDLRDSEEYRNNEAPTDPLAPSAEIEKLGKEMEDKCGIQATNLAIHIHQYGVKYLKTLGDSFSTQGKKIHYVNNQEVNAVFIEMSPTEAMGFFYFPAQQVSRVAMIDTKHEILAYEDRTF